MYPIVTKFSLKMALIGHNMEEYKDIRRKFYVLLQRAL
jgi:hypothetical protein